MTPAHNDDNGAALQALQTRIDDHEASRKATIAGFCLGAAVAVVALLAGWR